MHRDGHAIVDLPAYLREIADAAMCSLAGAERTEFSFDLNPHYITSPKQGVAIGLLVGEAITNALKYALPAGVAGKIQISSRESPDGRLAIEIADDGVGLPEGFDPTVSSGKGLRLMRALAEQLGGRRNVTAMLPPSARLSSLVVPAISVLTSISSACSGWRRENTSM
jgi:two-component sensor histidine kinase